MSSDLARIQQAAATHVSTANRVVDEDPTRAAALALLAIERRVAALCDLFADYIEEVR